MHLAAVLLALLLTVRGAEEKVTEEDVLSESLRDGILHSMLKIGGELNFKKYPGLKVNIEPKERLGPEKDPAYFRKQFPDDNEFEVMQNNPLVTLTESSFEHLTQAGSGMTTGHWFVLMGSPWCSYCVEMMGHWNRTARELKGDINVAYIDASNAPFTSRRFNVSAYPTLLLMKRGKFWIYDVSLPRRWPELITYARLTGEDEEDGEIIPPAHDSLEMYYIQTIEYYQYLYRLFWRDPIVGSASMLFGLLIGFVFPMGYILSAPMDPSFPGIKRDAPKYTGTKTWSAELKQVTEEEDEADDAPPFVPVEGLKKETGAKTAEGHHTKAAKRKKTKG